MQVYLDRLVEAGWQDYSVETFFKRWNLHPESHLAHDVNDQELKQQHLLQLLLIVKLSLKGKWPLTLTQQNNMGRNFACIYLTLHTYVEHKDMT